MDDKEMEKILANLRAGIARIESGSWAAKGKGMEYKAVPGDNNKDGEPDSTATGKYQFLKEWFDKSGKVQGIKQYAKSKNGAFGDIKSMEDFKNSPALQEAYFTYYAKKVLIPEALKMVNKNPMNLSVDEIASQFHFQKPSVARQVISTGKYTDATGTNVSGEAYVNNYRKGVVEAGLAPVTATDMLRSKIAEAQKNGTPLVLSPEEKELQKSSDEIKADFKKRDQAIQDLYNSGEIKEEDRNGLLKELYKEYGAKGHLVEANEVIEEQNAEKQQKSKAFSNLNEVFKGSEANYRQIKQPDGSFKRVDQDIMTQYGKGDIEQLKKDFPELAPYIHVRNDGKGKSRVVINQASKFGNKDIGTIQRFEKKFNEINKEFYGDAYKPAALVPKYEASPIFKMIGAPGGNATMMSEDFKNTFMNKRDMKADFTLGENQIPVYSPRAVINPENFPKEEVKVVAEDEKSGSTSIEYKKNDSATTKKEESINDGLADEYFKTQAELDSVQGDDFTYGDTKRDLPIDGLMGLGMGIIGNAEAKAAKIPLRTEEVSMAFKNYAAELQQIVKQGLPVEMEAAMKSKLADAYQGGLANIVNASAGNNATILGNQGGLEASRNKGIVDIQVADYQAKQDAFEKYGTAIQYMNEFDSRRDIANHAIKYGEAKEKQAAGKALATAGMTKVIDELKNQKENGPGSANDMYRSMLMQKMFGFDPKMKDDGSGKVGTQSAFDMKFAAAKEKEGITLSYKEKLSKLGPNAKKGVDAFVAQNKNSGDINKFIDYASENPNMDYSQMNMDNMQEAVKTENFGLLNPTAQTVKTNTTKTDGLMADSTISLTPEDLEKDAALMYPMEGGTEQNPMGLLNALGYGQPEDKLYNKYD